MVRFICFVQFTNLQEGHDYFFRVFANSAAGLSDEPAEVKPAVRAKLPFGKNIVVFSDEPAEVKLVVRAKLPFGENIVVYSDCNAKDYT